MIADAQIEALEQVLRDLLAEHGTLIELAGQHREALRRADGAAVTAVSLERDRVNERLVALNRERVEITSAIARSLGFDAEGVTVRRLVAALPAERTGVLAQQAEALREAVETARREHSVLRDATAAFAGHLGGVLHRAIEMCAPARTYTSRGRVAVGATLPSALDVRH